MVVVGYNYHPATCLRPRWSSKVKQPSDVLQYFISSVFSFQVTADQVNVRCGRHHLCSAQRTKAKQIQLE